MSENKQPVPGVYEGMVNALASPAEVVEPVADPLNLATLWAVQNYPLSQEFKALQQAYLAGYSAHPPQQEPARLREALENIARGSYDGQEVTHLTAYECRRIARAALAEDGL